LPDIVPSNLYNPDTPPEGSYDLHGFVVPQEPDVVRAMDGDKEAFARIVERYQGMVYTLAFNTLGSHVDAEDAAQEVFLRAYRKLPGFRGASAFSTWLFRLAVNTIIDYQRRERRAPVPVEVPERAAHADSEPLQRVGYGHLMSALAELPPDYRVPVVLRDVYGLEYKEIARVLDRPLGTVKAYVHRGRSALRLRLRGSGALDEEE
jgi:RNA polymerase sigma-70 factor (ECF subfamily)